MPRQGLDRARVIDAAVQIADADGLEGVTIARVAAALGVRGPSLYNHVDGRDGLLRDVALRAVGELGAALRAAATGRARHDALAAVARAYRDYARAHPGRYAATVRAPAPDDAELHRAAQETIDVVLAVLAPWELTDDEQIHAVRAVRSALHGFVAIEQGAGFGIDVDPDASFDWLVAHLAAGLGG